MRLVNRSTRRFVVTEVGQEVYRHARAMLAQADAALEAVEFARAEPRGLLKVSCPVALAQSALAPLLPQFLVQFPPVRLQLDVSNRRVDVLSEGFDVALRVRSQPERRGRPRDAHLSPGRRIPGGKSCLSRARRAADEPGTARRAPDARLRGRVRAAVPGSWWARRASVVRGTQRRAWCATTSSCCAPRCSPASASRGCRRAWCARICAAARCCACCRMEHSAGRPARRVPEPPRHAAGGARLHRFPGRAHARDAVSAAAQVHGALQGCARQRLNPRRTPGTRVRAP